MIESAVDNESVSQISNELGFLNQIDFERFIRLLFGKLEWKANLGETALRRKIIDSLWDWIDQGFQFRYSAFLMEKINCLFPRDFDAATEYLRNNFTSIPELWLTKIVAGPIIRNENSRRIILEELEGKPKEELPDHVRKFLITDKGKYWLNPILAPSGEDGKRLTNKENNESRVLKIAVAISGQMRGYESAFSSWRNVFGPHKFDYYVSTWKKNGVSGKIDHISKTQNRFYWGDLSGEMEDVISEIGNEEAFVRLVMPNEVVKKKDVISVYGEGCVVDIQDEDDLEFLKSNVQKMYYKMERCNSLIRYEEDYDLIIRIRPDLVIKFKDHDSGKITEFDLPYSVFSSFEDRNCIFAGYGYVNAFYGFGIDDKLAIGKSDFMDTYSRVYSSKENLTPHASLADHLFDSGIDAVGLFEHLDFSFADNRLPKREDVAKLIKGG